MKTIRPLLLPAVVVLLLSLAVSSPAAALGTAFTYQGRLTDGGSPANGNYDVRFDLFPVSAGGVATATATMLNVPVAGGAFTTTVDFGVGVFAGTAYWLEISTRTNGGGAYTILSPRQELTPTPYAIYAAGAAIADGAVTSAKILDLTIVGGDLANNTVTSSQLADSIDLGSTLANGVLNVYRTAANTPGVTLTGSGGQISTFGSDGLEQTRLWGPSWGELLLNDNSGNDTTVRLSANSDGGGSLFLYHSNSSSRVFLSGAAASGVLSLYTTNGSLRANLTGSSSGSSLTMYQADGGTGVVVDGEYSGAGLVRLYSTNSSTRINLYGQSPTTGIGGEVAVNDNTGTETIELLGQSSSTTGAKVTLRQDNGTASIVLDGEYQSSGEGGAIELNNSSGQTALLLDGDYSDGGRATFYGSTGTASIDMVGYSGGSIALYAADGSTGIWLDGESSGAGYLQVNNTNSSARIVLDGQSTGAGGEISVRDASGTETIEILGAEDVNTGGQILMKNAAGTTTIQLDSDASGNGSGYIRLYKSDGSTAITLEGDNAGDGRITTQELQITGGSDLSEQFDINATATGVQPGMVVCIDPQRPGELVMSTRAYDRTVAGVVSGAGGVKPGMLMGQRGTAADGKHPVALTGRVYCLADAGSGTIRPGDLLTTSGTPGHAMKVSNHSKAQGAIIGKAMTSLEKGRGLVLVLVSLQ